MTLADEFRCEGFVILRYIFPRPQEIRDACNQVLERHSEFACDHANYRIEKRTNMKLTQSVLNKEAAKPPAKQRCPRCGAKLVLANDDVNYMHFFECGASISLPDCYGKRTFNGRWMEHGNCLERSLRQEILALRRKLRHKRH